MASLEDKKKTTGYTGKKRYKVRFRVQTTAGRTKEMSRSFSTKTEAQAFLTAVEGGAEWLDPKKQAKLFSDLAEGWWKSTVKHKPHTRRSYYRLLHGHVLPHFGKMPQNTIQWVDVDAFVNLKLAHGYSARYVRHMLSVVSLVMGYAISSGLRRDNPADKHGLKVRRRKLDHQDDVLDMDQALRFVRCVRDPYKPMLWLMILTGLRPAEACGLLVRHLNFDTKVMHVKRVVNMVHGYDGKPAEVHYEETKSEAGDRYIPLDDITCIEIQEMLDARAEKRGRPIDPDEPLFESIKGGKPLIVDYLRKRIVLPALEAAGLPLSIRTYDTRHSHATFLIDSGATLAEVAERLGHADEITAIRVYYHLTKGRQRAMTEKLSEQRQEAEAREAAALKAEAEAAAEYDNVVSLFRNRKASGDQ